LAIKGAIFDLDGTLLESMQVWRTPYSYKTLTEAYHNTLILKDGARDFLDKLRQSGIGITLATATDRFLVEPALKRNKILGYFGGIFTCPEFNTEKFEPLIYEKALAFLGLEKSEALVFEDALYAAKTANAAGFRVVGVFDKWESGDIKPYCEYYIKSWKEAAAII